MAKTHIVPVHPGVYLKELLEELALSQYRLAQDIGVTAMRISHVVHGKRPVTAELALRLGCYFGQSPRYWLNLQSRYDMDIAEDELGEQVMREVRPCKAVASGAASRHLISDQELLSKAVEAQRNSYSPYSHFKVGAALLTKSGKIFYGTNVENASYGLALCAERTAIFSAVAAGEQEFAKLAVVCDCADGCLPCGACRQVMAEFAPDLYLILGTGNRHFQVTSLSALLPQPFLPSHLSR